MGLLYILPIDENEVDRVEIKDDRLILKSYGLPLVFWGYLAGILVVISAMGIAVSNPLQTLYNTGDPINQALALICLAVLLGVPLGFTALFFYEYRLEKVQDLLKIQHRLFGLPIRSRKIPLTPPASLNVIHFMDSPNMAKLHGDEELRGFQNKGHFLLVIEREQQQIIIDRSSRKADLVKLKAFLERY